MIRRLTIEISPDEIKEAIKKYVQEVTGDSVEEVTLNVDGYKVIHCEIQCAAPTPSQNKIQPHSDLDDVEQQFIDQTGDK